MQGSDSISSLSIIIPAHNEKACIGPLLAELMFLYEMLDAIEILLICNGCSDGTAGWVNQNYPKVKVLETEIASKVQALNLGNQHASYFPRIYMDADIFITAQAVVTLANELHQSTVLAASPHITFNTENASSLVKAYYHAAFWSDYNQYQLLSNVIAISEEGYKRTGEFPSIMADDEFLRRQFLPQERWLSSESTYQFFAPKTLSGLVKILSRARLGNLQLAKYLNEHQDVTKLPRSELNAPIHPLPNQYLRMCRKAGCVSFCIFFIVKIVAYVRSTYQFMRSVTVWERDDTSRQR